MIEKEVRIYYIVSCDECGTKLGGIEPVNNYIPKKEDILKQFAMFHTPEGKDICQSCFTKNFGKYCTITSASTIDKC